MGILKKLLMAVGVIAIMIVVIGAIIARGSVKFKGEQEAFISQFMADLSKHWSVAEVQDRVTNEFLQGPPVKLQQFMQQASLLGSLITIQDLELQNYFAGTGGKRGIFAFKAEFANGRALVTMTVVDAGNGARVQALNINPIGPNVDTSQREKPS